MREKLRVTGEKHDTMEPQRRQWKILPGTKETCQRKTRDNVVWLSCTEQKRQMEQRENSYCMEEDNLIDLFPTGIA